MWNIVSSKNFFLPELLISCLHWRIQKYTKTRKGLISNDYQQKTWYIFVMILVREFCDTSEYAVNPYIQRSWLLTVFCIAKYNKHNISAFAFISRLNIVQRAVLYWQESFMIIQLDRYDDFFYTNILIVISHLTKKVHWDYVTKKIIANFGNILQKIVVMCLSYVRISTYGKSEWHDDKGLMFYTMKHCDY